jgi:Ca2+-binding RTX toxin-like protein
MFLKALWNVLRRSLTTGVDTVPGSAGNDRIVAAINEGATGAPSTLTVLDLIDGGAGTDTLDISAVTGINVPAALRSGLRMSDYTICGIPSQAFS